MKNSLTDKMQSVLLWLAGVNKDLLKTTSPETVTRYTALGLVFGFNYVFLVVVWGKVGFHFFGVAGIFALGFLVPSTFLAVDRIIAMSPRKLSGQLAVYDVDSDKRNNKNEIILRLLLAITLSLMTTFTFMLDQSQDLIQAQVQAQAETENSDLRMEYINRINSIYDAQKSHFLIQDDLLDKQYATLTMEEDRILSALKEATKKARQSRDEAAAEHGGLGMRQQGNGPRYEAYLLMAESNEQAATQARQQLARVRQKLGVLAKNLSAVKNNMIQLDMEHVHKLENVSKTIRKDPRYVSAKQGLFAEATIFVGLYRQPQIAPGMIIFTFLLAAMLFCFESCALLALALFPTTPYDVARIGNDRLAAEKIVSQVETDIADINTKKPPVRLVPPVAQKTA